MKCCDCIHFRDNGGGWNTCSLPRAEDDGKGSDPFSEVCKDFQPAVCSECRYRRLVRNLLPLLRTGAIVLKDEDRAFVAEIAKSCGDCRHFQLEKFHVGTCDLGAEGHNVACVHDDACEDYQERE